MRTHKKYRSMNAICHIGKIKRLESPILQKSTRILLDNNIKNNFY